MFTEIIVGVDGHQGGRDAIALAKQLAAPNAQITLARVYGARGMSGNAAGLLLAMRLDGSSRLLERERRELAPDSQLVSYGGQSVGRGLQELAESRDADLLVVGASHHSVVGRAFLGDDASRTMHGAPSAVAIAPTGYASAAHRLSRIGVGYDGSPESARALTIARDLAARDGATVTALAVISLQDIPYGEPVADNWPEAAKQLVSDRRRLLCGLADVDGDATYGEPGDELAEFSRELDLLLIGSRSQGPIARLLDGSVSHYLASHALCPLLVIPRSAAMDYEESNDGDQRAVATESRDASA